MMICNESSFEVYSLWLDLGNLPDFKVVFISLKLCHPKQRCAWSLLFCSSLGLLARSPPVTDVRTSSKVDFSDSPTSDDGRHARNSALFRTQINCTFFYNVDCSIPPPQKKKATNMLYFIKNNQNILQDIRIKP